MRGRTVADGQLARARPVGVAARLVRQRLVQGGKLRQLEHRGVTAVVRLAV